MSKPTHWIVSWRDEYGFPHQSGPYYERARARGFCIILRAQGCTDVVCNAEGY